MLELSKELKDYIEKGDSRQMGVTCPGGGPFRPIV